MKTKAISENNKLKDLGSILSLLQSSLNGIAEDVHVSNALLPMGIMTGLSAQLQKAMDNPLQTIVDTATQIDLKIKQIINKSVVNFLKSKNDKILKAMRSETGNGDLFYAIVLKEDNRDNRQEIFDFLDQYDLLNMSAKYPILFQFMPIELADKINAKEEIALY
jgi:hypothetical protein